MATSRELRGLVPVEIAVVVGAAVVPLPIAAVVPLLVIASLSLWLRGRGFGERLRGPGLGALVGAGAGLVGLGLALVLGTPLVEAVTNHAVQWSTYPIVRGNASAFAMVAIVIAASAIAAELVLRGWIVERVVELGRGNVAPALIVGAVAEAALADGALAARLGAGVFGLGLGAIYVAGGRSLVAPICARVVFALGALALEASRLIG